MPCELQLYYKLQQLIFLGLRKGSFVNLILREFCAVWGALCMQERQRRESKKAKATSHVCGWAARLSYAVMQSHMVDVNFHLF